MSETGKPRIGVIIGSARDARFADKPADWFLGLAGKRDDMTFEKLDLRDFVDRQRRRLWVELSPDSERHTTLAKLVPGKSRGEVEIAISWLFDPDWEPDVLVKCLISGVTIAGDDEDPRVNPWGGAIAFGHPLASSGVRLMIQLARQFEEHPEVRYGLTAMCVGLGQGGTVIWENPHYTGKKKK